MTPRRPARADAAFTLVEVMVSLAIISVALLTLIVIRNNSVIEAQIARDVTLAARLAQQKMGQIEVEPFEERGEQGTFEGYPDIDWKKDVVLEVLETSNTPSNQKPPEIYKITLTVTWPKNPDEREKLEITSYRLKKEDEEPKKQEEQQGGKTGGTGQSQGAAGSGQKSGGS